MESKVPTKSWKYHAVILLSAVLIISVGAWIRNSITHKAEEAEVSLLETLQTEVQQLKSSLRKSELDSIRDIVAEAAKEAFPAVVSIRAIGNVAPRPVITLDDYGEKQLAASTDEITSLPVASGLLIDGEGHILTSASQAGAAKQYRVLFDGSVTGTAELVGVDLQERLALLKVQQTDSLPKPPDFNHAKKAQTGSWLIRLGRTQIGQKSIALGLLSTVRRDSAGRETYFLDAEFMPELDGSPAINLDGQAVGINVLASDRSKSVTIPIDHALTVAQGLKTKAHSAPQSFIGVELQNLTEEMKQFLSVKQGVLITRVNANSPASKAGLQAMDVLTRINEQPIISARALHDLVHQTPAGTKLNLTVGRAGAEKIIEIETVSFETADSSIQQANDEWGFGFELSLNAAGKGVEVKEVLPKSWSQRLGFQAGDLILAVNGNLISGLADFRRIQRSRKADEMQLWLVRRGEQNFCISFKESVKAQ